MIQFLLDRSLYFMLFGLYVGWYYTSGPDTWAYIYETTSDFNLFLLGTAIVSSICYFVFSSLFAILDLVLYPRGTASDLRIQSSKPPTWEMYKKALPVAVFNIGALGLPIGYIFFYFFHPASPYFHNTLTRFYPNLPSPLTMFTHLLVCLLVEEVLFYYTHRLFHIPALYARFHKKHHEFTSPIGISAAYTTPLDFAVTNIFPFLVGPLITKAHPVTVWAYFIEAIINTIVIHCGYVLPGVPNATMHDFHHEKFKWNFGVFGLLDYIHGTSGPSQPKLKSSQGVQDSTKTKSSG